MRRGHNRDTVFNGDDDFEYHKTNRIEFKEKTECKIYAYCLMTNHVQIIIDPGKDPAALSQFMKGVAGRQTRYINKTAKPSGSLWEGRFKSSIISTHEYLLSRF
nr:transposase [Desulfobacula sp.]